MVRICNQATSFAEFLNGVQKQFFRGVLRKRCSENMQQIHRRTPMPKCDSIKLQRCYISLKYVLNSNMNLKSKRLLYKQIRGHIFFEKLSFYSSMLSMCF